MRRIYHHWERLECIGAGMYNTEPPAPHNAESAKQAYCDFLADIDLFNFHMNGVIADWPISCEHFLSNSGINRIAWMGQAAMCHYSAIPCFFRAGFCLLPKEKQTAANRAAKKKIVAWLDANEKIDFGVDIATEPVPEGMKARIQHYIRYWTARGYLSGLPDEVPPGVDRENVAPSYKAIAITILRNDVHCLRLGYGAPKYSLCDMFYYEKEQTTKNDNQMELAI